MGATGATALIPPMLAVAGELPAEAGWAYEFKWDGVRAVAYAERNGRLRLFSRNDRDITSAYPEIAVLPSLLGGRGGVLDGELVTLDQRGAPSFSALQRRMHVRAPGASLIASTPVRYVVFDLLRLDRTRLLDRPWSQRRAALEELGLAGEQVNVSPVFDRDPDSVLAVARERGLEGVVSKRVESEYQPGRRSPSWRKTALIQTTEVLVAGYKPGAGRRSGLVGSLLLGIHEPAGLVYVGGVGTGFTDAMLEDLGQRLRRLERDRPPFAAPVPTAEAKNARWVEPTLVGEVVYRTVTPDGRLRHASWRGLRPDRNPDEVSRPSTAA
ncbi:bifunctional non-homologous end joining protein LigD [Micromonospora pisi]|uniref:DNA ligase (ATP) n=1 Tax=Micromonospora pisi TaxID=589240 RepID=A0A495JAP5_9ACTN|nr:non-homologous end-joining DNA ligase [Micromonospora pisi]RKR85975.1 bifunctional non-homologous end joining protein LigD [Micromonospora pisi]